MIRRRTCSALLLFFLAIFLVLLFYIMDTKQYYMSQPLGCAAAKCQNITDLSRSYEQFIPYSFGNVYTIADVCIELDKGVKPIPIGKKKTMLAKKLVVYNSKVEKSGRLKVQTAVNVRHKWWDIVYRTKPIPSNYTYIFSHPVYFVTTSCVGDLYHFWEDTLEGLYGVLKATNRLYSTELNQMLIRNPLFPEPYNSCHNKDRFQEILAALGMMTPVSTFHAVPENTCFRNAVFGSLDAPSLEVSDYVIKRIPFDTAKCKNKTVTIIQRLNRQILNADDLLKATNELGFVNSKVVVIENMTFSEQYSLIRCTDILVGVRGTGLHWSIFMRPKRGLLELSWEKFGFYFSKSASYVGYRGLKTASLSASKILLNWDTFGKMCRKGKNITKKQQELILKRDKILPTDNPYKWADAYFSVDGFKQTLMELYEKIYHA